ncbi:MAG: RHS repeat-associated core domain-containing protein, partial [Hyphomicrobium sp.]
TLNARFPGQWFQVESGLHYNWHRHYDPTIGRYTQPDPLGFVDGPSVYAYARNAPHEYVDSDGRQVALPFPVLVPPAIYCAAYPEKCSKLVGQCVAIFKRTFGGGGGGGGDKKKEDDDDDCEGTLTADRNCCLSVHPKRGERERCYRQGSERYSACLTGRTVPSLGWCGR